MILVTGGSGYVGSLLVRALLSLGERVRVVDQCWFGFSCEPHERLELVEADVLQCDPNWLEDVSAVIHLAGLSNDPTADFAPELSRESNVFATRELARIVAARAERQRQEIRFLFASTCSVYYTTANSGNMNTHCMAEDAVVAPTANYSMTKRLAEIELLNLANHYPYFCPVILRKGTLFGLAPRMRFDLVVNAFTLDAWRKRVLVVHGDGEAWRPLLHLRDAVDAYVHLLWAPSATIRGEIFNVVHKNYRILELAHWVAEILERHCEVEVRVKRDRTVSGEQRSYYVTGEKMYQTIGYTPARGVTEAVLGIWAALENGDFGVEPAEDPRYFNIRWLERSSMFGSIR